MGLSGCRQADTPYQGHITLYNMVIPLFFFESVSVLLVFLAVVAIEAFVIARKLQMPYSDVRYLLAGVNFVTTVIGYFLQGLLRIVAFIVYTDNLPRQEANKFFNDPFWANPVFQGITGNVGAGTRDIAAALVEITTGFILTFLLSVVVETYVLKRELTCEDEKRRLIPAAVFQANVASYVCLFAWVVASLKLVTFIP